MSKPDATLVSDTVFLAVSRGLFAAAMAGLLWFLIALHPPAWWAAVALWVVLAVPAALLIAPLAGAIALLAGTAAWALTLAAGAITRRSRA